MKNSHKYKAAATKAGLHVNHFGLHAVQRLLEMEQQPIPQVVAPCGRGYTQPAVGISNCIANGFAAFANGAYALTEKGTEYLSKLKAANLTTVATEMLKEEQQ